jgi:hypothetical protein
MEDVKGEVSQAQRNQSQAYVEMNGNLKRHDKAEIFKIGGNSQLELVANAESHESSDDEDGESDAISELIGHRGGWQLFWAFLLCLFQFPTTFHIFCLVFQVSVVSATVKVKWDGLVNSFAVRIRDDGRFSRRLFVRENQSK